MIPVDTDVQTTDKVLPAFLGAVGGFGEEDQAGAGAEGGGAVDPVFG